MSDESLYLVDHPCMYMQEYLDLLWRTCRPLQDPCLLTRNGDIICYYLKHAKNICFTRKTRARIPTHPPEQSRISIKPYYSFSGPYVRHLGPYPHRGKV